MSSVDDNKRIAHTHIEGHAEENHDNCADDGCDQGGEWGEFIEKPTTQRALRSLAFHLVYAVDRSDYEISLDEIANIVRKDYGVRFEDDSFALKLAKGAIDNRESLDATIEPLLTSWKINRLGCCTRLILRIAVWELLNTDTAPTVVINEAIELSKAFAEKDAFKFINGILDNVRRVHVGDDVV